MRYQQKIPMTMSKQITAKVMQGTFVEMHCELQHNPSINTAYGHLPAYTGQPGQRSESTGISDVSPVQYLKVSNLSETFIKPLKKNFRLQV